MVIARETNKYPDKSIINRHTKPRKPEYNALPRLVYLCRSSDACIAKTEYVKSVHARLTLHLHYHHTTLRTLSYVQNFRLQARPHEIFSSSPIISPAHPSPFHMHFTTNGSRIIKMPSIQTELQLCLLPTNPAATFFSLSMSCMQSKRFQILPPLTAARSPVQQSSQSIARQHRRPVGASPDSVRLPS